MAESIFEIPAGSVADQIGMKLYQANAVKGQWYTIPAGYKEVHIQAAFSNQYATAISLLNDGSSTTLSYMVGFGGGSGLNYTQVDFKASTGEIKIAGMYFNSNDVYGSASIWYK